MVLRLDLTNSDALFKKCLAMLAWYNAWAEFTVLLLTQWCSTIFAILRSLQRVAKSMVNLQTVRFAPV